MKDAIKYKLVQMENNMNKLKSEIISLQSDFNKNPNNYTNAEIEKLGRELRRLTLESQHVLRTVSGQNKGTPNSKK